MKEIRSLDRRIDEDRAAKRFRRETRDYGLSNRVEEKFARMEKHRLKACPTEDTGVVQNEAVAAFRRVFLENRPERFERTRTGLGKREHAVEVAFDAEPEQCGRSFDKTPNVTGEQATKLFTRDDGALGVEPRDDFAALTVKRALPLLEGFDLLGRELALDFDSALRRAFICYRLLEIVFETHALEQPPDNIKDLVGIEFLADFFELVEQRFEHAPLASA